MCGLGTGLRGTLAFESSVVGWVQGKGYIPPPPELTARRLFPQKVTPAAETKIHLWNETLTNHMPEWGGWSPVRRVSSISASQAMNGELGTPALHLLSHTRGLSTGVGASECWAGALAGSVQMISLGPHSWQELG